MSERPVLSAEVLGELRDALAEGALITDEEGVQGFHDPYGLHDDDRFLASTVVEPTTVEQVQEVMRIANRHGVPVWPHSQGRNNGYGGPSPRVRGSLQISLKKMNRVLEINEDLAYAVVEPGVSWFDLHAALEAGGHDLQVIVPDLGWGSVIGNQLDNGIGYMPLAADHQTLTGLEVVLADGSLLRTNMGAIPGNKAWHLYKRSLGPSLDPLFAQSNFGIVVRAGVWLQRKPQAYAPLVLTLKNDADLEVGVDTLRQLRLEGILEGISALMPTVSAAPQLLDIPVSGADLVDEDSIQRLAEKTGVGRWAVRTALWGRRNVVEAKLERVREVWEAIPGASVLSKRIYAPEEYGEIELSAEKIQAGIPTMQLLDGSPPNLGHVGFSPIVPLEGTEVRKVLGEMVTRIAEEGLNFLGSVYVINNRAACIVAGIPFDTTNGAQVEAAFRTARRLVKEIGALGYGEYRAHLDFMDDAQAVYSFEDGAYRRFVERIKDAVDPNGIIMPGRHGIWPEQYRHLREVRP
jgi:4-cresol dehydrogenase (hydroxylating)